MLGSGEAAKFLFSPPSVSPSHKLALIPLADELAKQGHDVLFWEVMADPAKYPPKIAKQDTRTITLDWFPIKDNADPIFQYLTWDGPFDRPFMESLVTTAGSYFCQEYLRLEPEHFRQMLETPWDVYVLDELFNTCSAALAGLLRHRHGTRLVTYVSTGRLTSEVLAMNGQPPNPSVTPAFGSLAGSTDQMNFAERVRSTVMTSIQLFIPHLSWLFIDSKLNAGLPKPRPPVRHGLLQPDLVLTANLQLMQLPMPNMRNIVHIGGIHLPQNLSDADSKLDSEWESRVNAYSGGFILIAMGHMADWRFAPPHIINAFIGALEQLPPDVLVIFQVNQGFPQERLPAHVFTSKWLPQRALLGHPKIRGFLSHGGANSIVEAVVYGVPMVVMPLNADQPDGAAMVEKWGMGVRVDKFSLNATQLATALFALLNEPKYKERAVKMRDMLGPSPPKSALERGLFWLNYLAKHKPTPGSKLGSRAPINRNWLFSWFQLFCFDLILPACAALVLVLWLSCRAVKKRLC